VKPDEKTEQISVRVSRKTKQSAERVFRQLGLSPTEAVRMFYHQVAAHRGLPFAVRIPNKETLAALRELDRGGGNTSKDAESFFRDMGI
jgi:DNA-damage-inducible protein J